MSDFNKNVSLLLHQQTSLVSSELGPWRRRWSLDVGTQASSYGIAARHGRRRPALPILTPPANPGLRVTTATAPQPRAPCPHAMGRSVWSLRTWVTGTGAPGVETAPVLL